MAENRTFQFYGVGYGSSPVSVTASINSTQIFSGAVPTVDQPVNPQPTPLPSDQVVLFTLPDSAVLNTDFAGSLPMTITVTGGSGVLFGDIFSNYFIGDPAAGAGLGNTYGQNYTGNPINSESTPDPRSSVQIDGVTQVPPLPTSLGVWNWYIPANSTFTYNWNISVGQVANIQGNVTNYSGPYTTTAPTI